MSLPTSNYTERRGRAMCDFRHLSREELAWPHAWGYVSCTLLSVPSTALAQEEPGIIVKKSDDGSVTVKVPASGVNLEALERALIDFALQVNGWNRSRAAQFLGLTRSALLYRTNKHQIRLDHPRVFFRPRAEYSPPAHPRRA